MNTIFQNWRIENSFIEKLIYQEKEGSRWGRLVAKWNEKQEAQAITHIAAFVIDLETGDLYLDCRKRKIWAKCFVLTLTRPLFGGIQTLDHAISIPIEIFKTIMKDRKNHNSLRQISVKALSSLTKNLFDIVRTPLYTLAITIVTLAAVIIGPLAPHRLYDLRALAGRLENLLNKDSKEWALTPCFQPIGNVMKIHQKNDTKFDTDYEENPTQQGLNNLVRSYVKFRQQNRMIFNDCGRLLNQQTPYISAAYHPVH